MLGNFNSIEVEESIDKYINDWEDHFRRVRQTLEGIHTARLPLITVFDNLFTATSGGINTAQSLADISAREVNDAHGQLMATLKQQDSIEERHQDPIRFVERLGGSEHYLLQDLIGIKATMVGLSKDYYGGFSLETNRALATLTGKINSLLQAQSMLKLQVKTICTALYRRQNVANPSESSHHYLQLIAVKKALADLKSQLSDLTAEDEQIAKVSAFMVDVHKEKVETIIAEDRAACEKGLAEVNIEDAPAALADSSSPDTTGSKAYATADKYATAAKTAAKSMFNSFGRGRGRSASEATGQRYNESYQTASLETVLEDYIAKIKAQKLKQAASIAEIEQKVDDIVRSAGETDQQALLAQKQAGKDEKIRYLYDQIRTLCQSANGLAAGASVNACRNEVQAASKHILKQGVEGCMGVALTKDVALGLASVNRDERGATDNVNQGRDFYKFLHSSSVNIRRRQLAKNISIPCAILLSVTVMAAIVFKNHAQIAVLKTTAMLSITATISGLLLVSLIIYMVLHRKSRSRSQGLRVSDSRHSLKEDAMTFAKNKAHNISKRCSVLSKKCSNRVAKIRNCSLRGMFARARNSQPGVTLSYNTSTLRQEGV